MTPGVKTTDHVTESVDVQALSEMSTEVYEDDEPGWLVYPVELYPGADYADGTPGEDDVMDWKDEE